MTPNLIVLAPPAFDRQDEGIPQKVIAEKKRSKGSATAPRQSVPLTANQRAKAIIEEFCPWDGFFAKRKAYLEGCDHYRNNSIKVVEGTVLKPYREIIDRASKSWSTEEDLTVVIAQVTELIQTHVEELGLNLTSGQKQPRQGGLSDQINQIVELHKKDPQQAANLAKGNPVLWNQYLKQVKEISNV